MAMASSSNDPSQYSPTPTSNTPSPSFRLPMPHPLPPTSADCNLSNRRCSRCSAPPQHKALPGSTQAVWEVVLPLTRCIYWRLVVAVDIFCATVRESPYDKNAASISGAIHMLQCVLATFLLPYFPNISSDWFLAVDLVAIPPRRSSSKTQTRYPLLYRASWPSCTIVSVSSDAVLATVPRRNPHKRRLLRMHTTLCELLVRSLVYGDPASLRAFSSSCVPSPLLHCIPASLASSTVTRRFCPSMSVRLPYPTFRAPSSPITPTQSEDFSAPALECAPGECAHLHGPQHHPRRLGSRGPRVSIPLSASGSLHRGRQLGESYTDNPAPGGKSQVQRSSIESVIHPPRMERNPAVETMIRSFCSGLGGVGRRGRPGRGSLVRSRPASRVPVADSVMRTADASALDEATVSALKRRVHAPPGKTRADVEIGQALSSRHRGAAGSVNGDGHRR
ncbi:hypothetical protein DFH06DRAFT_1330280 [Mycena polygramma]|nr:hypothetical protein DFH06DRAFT_1330280 [Mycena polygramma]